MATIPLLSKLGGRLAPRLAPEMPVDPSILVPEVSDALPRVIIAGFGIGAKLSTACGFVDGKPGRISALRHCAR
jgi:hypothetical protein